MTAWYDKAIFYHMYPLGMTGAPFANPYPASDETADVISQPGVMSLISVFSSCSAK